ncbi:MAG: LptA/OstA family protein [Verrucomicrobia bacterium]|nr:LptA/OstA family protein [Verrucomicrobiota bacterium]
MPLPAFAPPARPSPGQINLRPGEPAIVEKLSSAAPTVITSDELQMSMDKKVATFTGHVKVVDPQGTMTADKMIVYLAEGGSSGSSVNKIEATGGVVISQEGRRAIADEAVYTAADRIVILSGAAQVQTGNSLVTGETIVYDMNKNTAVVKGRPRMTIPQSQKGGGSGGLFPSMPKLPTPTPAPTSMPTPGGP